MKLKFSLIIFVLSSLFIFSCADDEIKDTPGSEIKGIEDVDSANDTGYSSETEDNTVKESNNSDTAGSNTETVSSGLVIFLWIMFGVFVIIGGLFFTMVVPLGLWYEARLSGVKPGWWNMTRMKLQRIPQKMIIKTLITAKNANLEIATLDMMEKYLAGVNVKIVTNTAVRAINAGFPVSYNELAAQFLAKVDVETVMHALITAKNADLDVSLKQLAGHYLANVDVIKVVEALITAHNAGYDVFTLNDLKEHYLANGNVTKTVDAFIAAKEADFHNVTFKDISAIDLAGIDVTEAVQSAVNPVVVETGTVTGVAKDGVQLHMKLKLTLRANLKQIIGGATEQTVLARIDESLATEIGRAASHYDILENPFLLADIVEQKNLGDGTAYDVISVDVSQVNVGKDIHAELQAERAHADSETAKANLIEAEEKVKKSMAAAFLDGKLSIDQYHQIMNIEADTDMRKKLADAQIPANKVEDDHHKNDDFDDVDDMDDES